MLPYQFVIIRSEYRSNNYTLPRTSSIKYHRPISIFVSDVSYVWMTLYAMIVAATMVGMFDFCKMAKSGLEKRQIGKKRKEADERHATLFSFYCLPLRYILTPDHTSQDDER